MYLKLKKKKLSINHNNLYNKSQEPRKEIPLVLSTISYFLLPFLYHFLQHFGSHKLNGNSKQTKRLEL